MNKAIFILRGASQNGKSTLANYLKENFWGLDGHDKVICCADDYFYQDGKYNFVPSKIKDAHQDCRKNFDAAIEKKTSNIIIANTNTQEWEWKYYEEEGKSNGYTVFFLVVEKRHEGTNDHNVPSDIIQRQADNVRKSLKLT